MKTITMLFAGALAAAVLIAPMASAADIQSGRTEIFDNPFIATGFNPQTRALTGYVQGLRTAPGRTDACQFIFSGKVDKPGAVAVVIREIPAGVAKPDAAGYRGSITLGTQHPNLLIDPKQLPGDCEWILPEIGEPKVRESGKNISLPIEKSETGAWIAVNVIASKRAFFHNKPDAGSACKTFLVAGDVAYVHEEKPGWIYVKYHSKKKETIGWIKKADTVKF